MSRSRSFTIERTAPARCSVESMMRHVLDATAWPAWQPEIVATRGSERVVEGEIVSGSARLLGFGVEGKSIAVKVADDVFEEEVVVGVAMRVRYEVQPDGEFCRVTHRLESNMPTGISGRLLSAFLRGRLRRMQKTALERLVAQSESDS